MTERHTVDSINSDQLDQLYAEVDRLAAELADYDERAEQQQARAITAEAANTRVAGLYERWVQAGPPPLGVLTARWWDARLVELHAAIRPPADESARTTAKDQP